jgi:hypothetical protein
LIVHGWPLEYRWSAKVNADIKTDEQTANQLKPQSTLTELNELGCQFGQANRGFDWDSTPLQSNPSPTNVETNTLLLYINWADWVPYLLMYPAMVETSTEIRLYVLDSLNE